MVTCQGSQTFALESMHARDLDAVMAIEVQASEYPWIRGNFSDCLASGYEARVLRSGGGAVLGYFVAMMRADEMYLLNMAVAPSHQGVGVGGCLLDALTGVARSLSARAIWLEVCSTNARARTLYSRRGFRQVGIRRGYYPAAAGTREDALVMTLSFECKPRRIQA